MPVTYTDEVNIYNPNAIASDITAAGNAVKRYVTDITGGGAFVHPADDDTVGVRISEDVTIVRNGSTVASYGDETVIGEADGPHVKVTQSGIDFYAGPEAEAGGEQVNRVGYIATDSDGSLFYMTKAVIVTDLRFSNWQWRSRDNGNLSLKWMGGDE